MVAADQAMQRPIIRAFHDWIVQQALVESASH